MSTGRDKAIVGVPVGTPIEPTAAFDERTRRLLQVLGEAALQLASGQSIDNTSLERYIAELEPSSGKGGLLTVPEVCARLRISRWNFYQLIHQRQLHSVTIGRRRYVRHHDLSHFIAALGETGGAP